MRQFAKAWAILGLAISVIFVSPNVTAQEGSIADAAGRLPETGFVHLGLYNDGERDGFMRLGWYREGDDLVVYDRSLLSSAEIYETMEARMKAADFRPESVAIRFHRGSDIFHADIQLGGDKAAGELRVERPGQEIQRHPIARDLPENTVLRVVTFLLPFVLRQEQGTSVSYPWYVPLGDRSAVVTLTAQEGGEVETPGGTFDTVRYELRGDAPENDIYVTKGAGPKIVRIDVLGGSLQFLALGE